jgi:DNA-directed RNA polymerase specialized sigma24 family protein
MEKNLFEMDTELFYETAKRIAIVLGKKYYTVASIFEAEDIVQMVAMKVVQYNTIYDASKGKYSTFLYRLINNTYIDLGRKYKNQNMITSLDKEISDTENADLFIDVTESGTLNPEEKVFGDFGYEYIIENLPCESDRISETPLGVMNMSIRNLVMLKFNGFTTNDISEWFNVNPSNINSLLRKGKRCVEAMSY